MCLRKEGSGNATERQFFREGVAVEAQAKSTVLKKEGTVSERRKAVETQQRKAVPLRTKG